MVSTKLTSLENCGAELVADGDTVFLGGFGHAIPYASGHELIRAGRRDLTICRSGTDILADQLLTAGCVKKVVFGWIGNPDLGISHAFRQAVREGSIEWEEWTNWSMVLRFQAAAMGVPFLPARVLLAGDIPGQLPDLETVACPYTGEPLAAIPALEPDVAIVHAQRADLEGNTQMWGVVGDTVAGALAARRIVVTVEEIVGGEVIRSSPDRTVIPGHRVTAVAVVPWGAHPSYVEGYYTRDDDHFRHHAETSRTLEGREAYLDRWVRGVDRERYLSMIDCEALAAGATR